MCVWKVYDMVRFVSENSFIFYLKNNHPKDLNFEFQLNRSNRFDTWIKSSPQQMLIPYTVFINFFQTKHISVVEFYMGKTKKLTYLKILRTFFKSEKSGQASLNATKSTELFNSKSTEATVWLYFNQIPWNKFTNIWCIHWSFGQIENSNQRILKNSKSTVETCKAQLPIRHEKYMQKHWNDNTGLLSCLTVVLNTGHRTEQEYSKVV